MLAERGRQMGGQQQAQAQKHLSEPLSCSEASATTAVKPAAMCNAGPDTKASTSLMLLASSLKVVWLFASRICQPSHCRPLAQLHSFSSRRG